MRHTKKQLAVLAAAGAACWLPVPMARAGFTLTVSVPQVSGGVSDYVIYAYASPTSVTTPPTQGLAATTTNLINGIDITVNTTPGFGTLVIDTNDDIDGDGSPDANVVGAPDVSFGQPRPTFGGANGTLGTFLGLAAENATGTQATAYLNTAITPSSSLILSETVYEGAETATENPKYEGVNDPLTYLTGHVTSNFESGSGTLDPDYTSADVHSLEIVEALSKTALYNPGLTSAGIPVANVVVPTGTQFTVTAALAYNISGDKQLVSLVAGPNPPPPALLVTSNFVTGPILGSVTPGSNLALNPVSNDGCVQLSGGGQTGMLLLKFSDNGFGDPFSADAKAIVAYLQSANPEDTITSTIPANIAAEFPGVGYDVLVEYAAVVEDPPTGSGEPTGPFLNLFGLGDFSGNLVPAGDLDVADVGLVGVPEPLGSGILAFGALGLVSRPRRRRGCEEHKRQEGFEGPR
jgi:uncharacterized protein (DUF2141 family)